MDDSLGSAIQENERYMESLEARTNQLKATFQDLANNVIDNELVKVLLNLANTVLSGLNNEVGQTAIQFGLLGGVLTGGISIWGTLLRNLFAVRDAMGVIIPGGSKLATVFGTIASKALPIAGAISAIAVAGWNFYKFIKEVNPSLEEATERTDNLNSQLESNKKRLEEINNLAWYDRTEAINAEEEALKKENDLLEQQIVDLERIIDLKEQEKKSKGTSVLTGETVYGVDYRSGQRGQTEVSKTFQTLEERNEFLKSLGVNLDNVEESARKLGITLSEFDEEVTLTGADLKEQLTENVYKLIDAFESGDSNARSFYDSTRETLVALSEGGEYADHYATMLVYLDNAYQAAITATQKLNTETNKFSDTTIDVDSKIEELRKLAVQAGATATFIAAATDPTELKHLITVQKMKGSTQEEIDRFVEEYFGLKTDLVGTLFGDSGKTTGSTSTGTKTDPLKAQRDKFQKQISALSSELDILGLSGGSSEAQIQQLQKMQEQAAKAMEWYRKQGLADNHEYVLEAEKQWWEYQQQIDKIYQEIADSAKEAYEQSLDAQIGSLEDSIGEYEAAFGYLDSLVDDEISALESLKQEQEDYYDGLIDSLQTANEELEQQIALEKAQDALAKARQSKVLVYQDGKYQYVSDIDAVSAASKSLTDLEREQQLQDEISRLESLKKEAVDNIDDQIKAWEEYREQWASVAVDFEKSQNRLIAEQKFGTTLEKLEWETRLTNLQEFVDSYAQEMARLAQLEAVKNGSASGGRAVAQAIEGGMTQADKDALAAAGREYNQATTPEGKAAAHAKAEAIRAKYGYSGGVTGAEYIPTYASGTLGAKGGLSLVGEHGPELRVLGESDGILPTDITKNLWAWGSLTPASMMSTLGNMLSSNSTRSMTVHISNLNLPEVKNGNDFVQYMKNNFWRQTVQFATT